MAFVLMTQTYKRLLKLKWGLQKLKWLIFDCCRKTNHLRYIWTDPIPLVLKQASICRSHVGIVDAGTIMSVWIINTYHHTEPEASGWFLRKSRPFIFKYRPLGPTYFNIWGIFTIVGIFLIKWYNIPLMPFVSLTIEGAHS